MKITAPTRINVKNPYPARAGVVTAIFAACLPGLAHAAENDSVAPPPRIVELLRKQHHPRDWLYVTTPSGRYEFRVYDIGPLGLTGLRARGGEPLVPVIGWSEVARIERRYSHFRAGQIMGVIVGATAAGCAGAWWDNSTTYRGQNPIPQPRGSGSVQAMWVGIPVGAIAGGWFGGRWGDRFACSRTLYGADLRTPALSPVEAQSGAPGVAAAKDLAGRAGKDVLRVQGTFGEVTGVVSKIDANGLAGVRPDTRFDSGSALPVEPLAWSQVTSVDRLGTASARYAAIGAVLVGGLLGSLGAAIAAAPLGLSTSGASDTDIMGGFALGAGAGALIGAGAGALIGMKIRRWHHVYATPHPLDDSARP